jgi:multiple sugar transport system substrate-binding protein
MTFSRHNYARYTLGLLLASLSLAGIGCKQPFTAAPVSLTWWGTAPLPAGAKILMDDYRAVHPNITIRYRQVRPEEFDQTLLRALAANQGPDIISFPNTSLRSWQDYLSPLPATLTLPFLELKGVIKKEPTATLQTVPTMDLRTMQDLFVDAVPTDIVIDGKIYGFPLNLDSLLLFYNRDLLNAAGFASAPQSWTEFKNAVQKITRIDKQGHLLQNGAALGTADNVPYAADILAALMLQNGTPMLDGGNTRATFNQPITVAGQTYSPGADAVRFYTDFANPSKETYSWSKDEPSAWTAFADGKVGFTFGYWRDYLSLKQNSPRVTVGIGNFPQIDNTTRPTYLASYDILSVTAQSKYQNEAWGFVHFAVRPEEAEKYLGGAKLPTAERQLYQAQAQDPDVGLPTRQVLTARSWYHGYNPKAAQGFFLELIRRVNGGTNIEEALDFAVQQVTRTLAKVTL